MSKPIMAPGPLFGEKKGRANVCIPRGASVDISLRLPGRDNKNVRAVYKELWITPEFHPSGKFVINTNEMASRLGIGKRIVREALVSLSDNELVVWDARYGAVALKDAPHVNVFNKQLVENPQLAGMHNAGSPVLEWSPGQVDGLDRRQKTETTDSAAAVAVSDEGGPVLEFFVAEHRNIVGRDPDSGLALRLIRQCLDDGLSADECFALVTVRSTRARDGFRDDIDRMSPEGIFSGKNRGFLLGIIREKQASEN